MNYPFRLCAFADEAGNTLKEQISALNDNGIGLLELRSVDSVNVSVLTAAQARQIKAKLDANNIKVWSIGSPSGKIDITDDFMPHLDSFKAMIELSYIFGADHYRLFSFYGACGEISFRDEVMERLSQFVQAAKGSGVTLCHENEKDIYGDTAERCLDILKTIPEIKAIFDPANFIQCGEDTLRAWELISPYIEYMHIKDATEDGKIVPAGQGIGNIKKILENYKAKASDVVTLEPHLSVFSGLDKLEKGDMSKVQEGYPTQRAAFDAGVNALKLLF